jgi:nitrite reductase (NO-forming) / hydroxylamine reductase
MSTKMLLKRIPVYLLFTLLILPLMTDSAFAARGGWRWNTPNISNQSFNIDENSANGTVVGTVLASDPNGDSLSYSITGGNSSGAFAINASNGVLTVANSAALDYETITQFGLTVRVADPGGLDDSSTITVALNDVDETTPNNTPDISNQSFNIDENSANGTVVGTVSAADPDGDSLSYAITAGNASGAFAINAGNGVLTVANSAALDFETLTQFGLTVQVVDAGGLDNSATISVTLNNVADGASSPYPAGEALYNSTCFACHGSDAGGRFVRRSIRGFNTWTINNAINNVPSMNFLSYLTGTERNDIRDYLTWLPSAGNPERLTRNGDAVAGEALYRENCTGCHSLGTSSRVGPDLLGHSENCATGSTGGRGPGPGGPGGGSYCERLEAFIAEPLAMATHAYSEAELAQYPFIMSDLELSDYDALDIATYIGQQTSPMVAATPVALTETEFEQTRDVYFDRCAGCHGLYRTGATGPEIGEARSIEIGTDGLAAMMRHGTPGGMPNFGAAGILTEDEINKLAAYLQLPPPEAPALEMPEIQASWELMVPVASRPAAPQHSRNWENFFGVVLRDAGKIAIFDGDSHEEISRVDVGFAVHILRSSASGRYFYAIGRDGWVNLIDLWASVPNVVAKVKGCHDARSVDGSKFEGFEDQYLIEGCYWPPQYVTYDGLTLEPQNLVKLPMISIDGETLPEVRVAAIVASEFAPVWVVNQKESGYVGIVDYSQEGAPLVANIATARFLHDGGWDHSKRYFMTAANASDKIVVVDVQDQALEALIEVGSVPHPGRGANWEDPVYGWVNATPHIGSSFISVYGADPVNNPEHAWKVVRQIDLPAAGSLFIKTHPNSPWVLVDMTLSATNDKQICAIAKSTGAIDRCFDVATAGKAVHMEFNKDGREVWISDWAGEGGGQVILDGTTLKMIQKITLPATTGKFNVTNTAEDIY